LHPAVVTLDELILRFGREKRNGKRVVFTNGCFDVLHPGHIHSLEAARALGDCLIVGLNGDESVRALKGPDRPVLPAEERAEVEAAGGRVVLVDAVPGYSTTQILKRIRGSAAVTAKGEE